MKKLIILDSNSIINRAFYGVRALNARDGTPTNAIYGFLNIFLKLIDTEKPDYVCAAFDLKAPTFRHKMYDQYKAQRHPMPEELVTQMPLAKEILRTMDITILEKEGYEADDIIGTVARICDESETVCRIVTGDKDDLQLVSENTNVLLTVTRSGFNDTTLYDLSAVKERYHVTPQSFIDIKALMGDASDNIPGVSGIGEKTAMSLIERFGNIEYIYEHVDEAGLKGKMLEKIKNGKDSAFLSKKLATIDRFVPLEFKISDCAFTGDFSANAELYKKLQALDLNSLIKRMALIPVPTEENAEKEKVDIYEGTTITELRTEAELEKACADLSAEISFIPVFTDNELACVSFAAGKHACYTNGLNESTILKYFRKILENKEIKKYVCDIKDAMVKLAGKTEIKGIAFDAAIASYVTDPSRKDFDIVSLAADYLGVIETGAEAKQMSLLDEDETNAEEIYAKRALAIKPLCDLLAEKIEKLAQHELCYDVEFPLISVLAHMQINGFVTDTAELKRFSGVLTERIDELTEKIYKEAGEEFNLNSPKQLGVILFEKLGLRPVKKTKTGYSTNADVLEKIAWESPVVADILEYRKYAKLRSTYCDGLAAVVNPETGRIHSNFNQTVTVTGRISSTEPNMQNIPTRTELGREIRKMFVAAPGYILIDADYSQIELRVMAHMSHDKTMINAFRSGEDIHTVTAAEVLGIPVSEVSKEERTKAKVINFGIIYGMGEFSLAGDLHISLREAKEYIEQYMSKYSGVRDYLEKTVEEAKKTGYVTTIMNRIRYIPELSAHNANVRKFGERVARNTPIQGSAADIIKLAMVKVDNRLIKENMRSKLILQVHDELIVEAAEDEAEKVKTILREEMENAMHLDVPLAVDMGEGRSWYGAKA